LSWNISGNGAPISPDANAVLPEITPTTNIPILYMLTPSKSGQFPQQHRGSGLKLGEPKPTTLASAAPGSPSQGWVSWDLSKADVTSGPERGQLRLLEHHTHFFSALAHFNGRNNTQGCLSRSCCSAADG